ncbi:arylformamidase [Lentibacillus amyloliquefaciens]|uniref:Kynurenine formamidase n=1 Tax=Lentibacillus amyloliquefaciens TaxID=1472767 RepID=A0A0U4FK13_9BACI|nr:arylformamidase [Lentibacillus amyloliquefaciens]ALX48990.1 kynurenine formamidase [Lentibacillus amyloliquefaciens]
MTQTNWIDISQPLTQDMAHFPGDAPFDYSLTFTKAQTGSANVGQLTGSVHIGTHIDAPFHYDENGKTVDQLDVNMYIGNAVVLDVSHTERITADTLKPFDLKGASRVLLHTSLPNNPKRFPEQIPELDPSIADFLGEQGVVLLGVDIPSVDPPESKELPVHHALYRQNIFILENLMLDHVEPGQYELIALPLAINGADGSPVRAVLRPVNE